MRPLVLLTLLTAGCDAPDETSAVESDSCGTLALPIAVEMGFTAPDQTRFEPFGQTGLLPITAGFQGLVFVSFALRSTDPLPPRMEASIRLIGEDGAPLLPVTKTSLFFEPQTDGSSIDPNLLLLLDPPFVASWTGVTGLLEVEVYGGSRCATLQQRVELTDRGSCTMDESGAIQCNPEGR